MTPSGVGSGGNKAVCLRTGFIVKTEGFKTGTYNPGDAVTADEAQFTAMLGTEVAIPCGGGDVAASTDMHPVGSVIEHDSAEGTLIVEVP